MVAFNDNVTAFFVKSSENRREFAKKRKKVGADRTNRTNRTNRGILCAAAEQGSVSAPLGVPLRSKAQLHHPIGVRNP